MDISILRRSLKAAAQQASMSLATNTFESLAKKIAFSLDLRNAIFDKDTNLLPKLSSSIEKKNAATIASLDLRLRLKIGQIEPIFNLAEIISDKLKIFVFTIEDATIRGACILADGVAFIFLPSTSNIDRLYTCARHLGYLLSANATHSKSVFAVFESMSNLNSLRRPFETFADSFALEFLIPNRGLGIALKEVRNLMRVSSGAIGDVELLYVSRIFGVGFLEVARKCELANLLPRGGAVALHQFLVEKFGGPEVRARDLELPPRPMTSIAPVPNPILYATVDQIRNGSISVEQAATDLGCSATFLKQRLYQRSRLH